MIFSETRLPGAFTIDPERREDDRGFFARVYCEREFREHGLNPRLVQCSVSFNRRRGTLRGMHFQSAPYEEAKLVRCTRGAVYDVVVDLRPGSPAFRTWVSAELTAENRCMMYVPEGCAHGFQTLHDDTEVFYQMSEFYHPEAGGGIPWNDPAIGIVWPLAEMTLSERDRGYPPLAGPGA